MCFTHLSCHRDCYNHVIKTRMTYMPLTILLIFCDKDVFHCSFSIDVHLYIYTSSKIQSWCLLHRNTGFCHFISTACLHGFWWRLMLNGLYCSRRWLGAWILEFRCIRDCTISMYWSDAHLIYIFFSQSRFSDEMAQIL